ncbi:MAG: hypothetical protein CL491_16350 [Acinetobacter sp.]|nr:hypothetical protein [Acinetobacter sp.]|tara:strand:+ start:531 stop:734 length:204 start_codon:yes stop_codon:yes gene_type:complete
MLLNSKNQPLLNSFQFSQNMKNNRLFFNSLYFKILRLVKELPTDESLNSKTPPIFKFKTASLESQLI